MVAGRDRRVVAPDAKRTLRCFLVASGPVRRHSALTAFHRMDSENIKISDRLVAAGLFGVAALFSQLVMFVLGGIQRWESSLGAILAPTASAALLAFLFSRILWSLARSDHGFLLGIMSLQIPLLSLGIFCVFALICESGGTGFANLEYLLAMTVQLFVFGLAYTFWLILPLGWCAGRAYRAWVTRACLKPGVRLRPDG